MIHLTFEDARFLYESLHPVGAKGCNGVNSCKVCNTEGICDALLDAIVFPSSAAETALHNACIRYREYTDAVCDIYTCPNCPDYSWCTTLLGIAIEGVKLVND